jgi:hypothetical protein
MELPWGGHRIHSPGEKERFCAVDLVQLCGLLGYRIPPCIAGVGGGSDFFGWVDGTNFFTMRR